MSSFFLALLRALATPTGSSAGELFSVRRKSRLLEAEWHAQPSRNGKEERHTPRPLQE